MSSTQALCFATYTLVIGGPSLAAAAIGETTPVQLGMVVSSIVAAAAMTWRISRWVGRIESRLDRIEGVESHRKGRK